MLQRHPESMAFAADKGLDPWTEVVITDHQCDIDVAEPRIDVHQPVDFELMETRIACDQSFRLAHELSGLHQVAMKVHDAPPIGCQSTQQIARNATISATIVTISVGDLRSLSL